MLKYIRIIALIIGIGYIPCASVAAFVEGRDDVVLPEGFSQITQDDV